MGCIYFERVLQDFDATYFSLSCPRHCDSGLIVIIVCTIFKSETKKEHNIIINRVISCHVGPMHIETPDIY